MGANISGRHQPCVDCENSQAPGEGAAAAWRLATRAAQPGRLPTIGFLGPNTRSAGSEWIVSLVQRLRELGWIDGRNVVMEYRWGEGREERFAEFAAEFVGLKVDVIVHIGNPGSDGFKAGDISHPDCVCDGGRPGWEQSRRQPGATGRQRHRPSNPGG